MNNLLTLFQIHGQTAWYYFHLKAFLSALRGIPKKKIHYLLFCVQSYKSDTFIAPNKSWIVLLGL
jgi:hypothetical protein